MVCLKSETIIHYITFYYQLNSRGLLSCLFEIVQTLPQPHSLFKFLVVQLHMIVKIMEMPGIELGASHMQSERSTTELHPHTN